MRLIDADVLQGDYFTPSTTNAPNFYYVSAKQIESAPTVDAEPVRHGRWLKHGYSCPCSICGFDFGWVNIPMELMIPLFNYCPNCGAKMDGKEQSNETVSL